MIHQQLITQIASTAETARNSGQSVTIDHMLPTVLVYRGENDEFFFQEHEASGLLEEINETLELLSDEESVSGISEEEVILHLAQGW